MCPTGQDGDKKPKPDTDANTAVCQLCKQPLNEATRETYKAFNRRHSDKS